MQIAVRVIIGAALGALAGLALNHFIGCSSGACPLTANRYVAMLIWAILGAVLASRL